MNFSTNVQQAIDLGLLTVEDGKIVSCRREEAETITAISRVIEKIQPTTAAQSESTTDQEAIVLARVLSSVPGKAKELWTELRVAFGVSHSQSVPDSLWSTDEFRAIGCEIDSTYLGDRDAQLISRESLIKNYTELSAASQTVSLINFTQTVANLAAPETLEAYGDADAEWGVALDLLRQARVKSLYNETMHQVTQVQKADTKMEKTIEFQQQKLMECLGMLRGTIGQQGNSQRTEEALMGDGKTPGLIDRIMNTAATIAPVSTGIGAFDIDMEGGVYPAGSEFTGGRLFALAARTGVGKTVLAVDMAVGLAVRGLQVGFISAELDKNSIWTRIASCLTTKFGGVHTEWAQVGDIQQPDDSTKEETAAKVMNSIAQLKNGEGDLIVDAPWAPDVDDVINIMRSMKARNPDLRVVFLDHFHVLKRHKNAPHNESGMMEDRAYRLMTAAKEMQVDLITLAQMNRVGMDAIGKKEAPGLDQIRGTDALSHVCHAVWIARKEMEGRQNEKGEAEQVWTGNLELWHVKNRGRQAEWDGTKMKAIKGHVSKSVLLMDYNHCRVRFCERNW